MNSSPDTQNTVRLRALAHPLRWKLLHLVSTEGTATATRCAQVLGESVASCAYHLGILGKYGYLEPVPAAGGRERPWRVIQDTQDLSPTDRSVEAMAATEVAAEAFLAVEFEQMKANLAGWSQEEASWADATGIRASTVYVTAQELRKIGAEFLAIMERYKKRTSDSSLRPPGARPARLFTSATVPPEHPTTRS